MAGQAEAIAALYFMDRKDNDRAFSDAMQGHSLLSAWSVAWDKRWPANKWLSLSMAILNKLISKNHRGDGLTLKTVRKALAANTLR